MSPCSQKTLTYCRVLFTILKTSFTVSTGGKMSAKTFYLKALIAAWVVLAALTLLSGSRPVHAEKKKKVKIALACPLTGDVASMGQGMKKGALLAIQQANKKNAVKGIEFELLAVDDRADPKEAVSAANKIISDPAVAGVVGHLNSGCSIPSSRVYARRKIAMITPASTNPKLTLQGLKNVFRICTTDDVQGAFAGDFVFKKMKKTKVAIIHDKTPYGQGLAEEFKKRFTAHGGKVISFDSITVQEKDFKALLTRIKGLKPQALYFGGLYSEAGIISKQSKEVGLNVPLIGGDGVMDPQYIQIGGKATEGAIITMVGEPIEKIPAAKKFISEHKKAYPGEGIGAYNGYTFDAVNIFIDVIKKVGTDRQKIIAALPSIKFRGVMGDTRFDKKGDNLNKVISAYEVKNAKFVFVASQKVK